MVGVTVLVGVLVGVFVGVIVGVLVIVGVGVGVGHGFLVKQSTQLDWNGLPSHTKFAGATVTESTL